ncbi:CDP-diacylglycerol--glycerol-3-phosphate 3-phosphatidyltransferase [[Mycoplasma] testudinis]|uniref:CDP-diacylglycerol--glycerol-3-phosphate 3-phosphatidyltransferase n=1 Tax=[Mycoplasma] testudinis TaxID=33924 RepID=UPI0038CC1518
MPNILTIVRIILFIPVVALVASQTPVAYTFNLAVINAGTYTISVGFVIAAILFILASVSDWLDGYLARKWRVISDFGKLWDPIADKVLVNSLLITLAALGYVHFGLVVVFIVRDIVMDGLRMFALRYNVVVAANIYGKLKTVFQMLAIIFTLFIFGMNDNQLITVNSQIWFWLGQMLLYWIALFFAVLSWAIYYFKISTMIKIQNTLKGFETPPRKTRPS